MRGAGLSMEDGFSHSLPAPAAAAAVAAEVAVLQKQLVAMRRKLVNDRAQANSTITALRAEKEASEESRRVQLEQLTTSRKRVESGLTTKIAGLEQEVQKLRAQARTRAKRRKEQEKVRR
jgi:hypothetical protein